MMSQAQKQCLRHIRYVTPDDAAIARIVRRKQGNFRIYYCEECEGYHLATKDKKYRKARRNR